jgi:hypothetical protein
MGVTGTPGDRRGETARAFVGRAPEIQALVAAADDSEQGRPQLVVIVGPSGIGKSALVASALDRLPQFRPIIIRADESESLLDYSVLGQLTGALPRRQVAGLPCCRPGRLVRALGCRWVPSWSAFSEIWTWAARWRSLSRTRIGST